MKYFIIAALLATAMARPSGPEGPDGDGPFPCLSAEHKTAAKTCMQQAINQTADQIKSGTSSSSSFCLPNCMLTKLNAIDSSNQIISSGLEAVITATNLTDAQKTNATAVLKECLADTTVNATTLMSQCMGRAPNGTAGGRPQGGRPQGGRPLGGRPQGGQQGGRPQGGPHPPMNMSAECQVAAKGAACLGKALSINSCGPKCGPRPGGKQ